ncbi:hypothetical protein C9374_011391 [Naegleria lovaniensis]|uniref:Uncharacterized protein n=1 Tax=Naegleria lovaniensis TaxID=51637 RepID=A0AA88H4E9_NAELO|nr:uncharacterized protein C9374_011391 [Naegleria lovaniensis]KAG2392666.1 hypothetical protein C9374_011391 [Naegleria lovaniensis]
MLMLMKKRKNLFELLLLPHRNTLRSYGLFLPGLRYPTTSYLCLKLVKNKYANLVSTSFGAKENKPCWVLLDYLAPSSGFITTSNNNNKNNIRYFTSKMASNDPVGTSTVIVQRVNENNISEKEYIGSFWKTQLPQQLMKGIWDTEKDFSRIPYHLIDNMYHSESGLYSEGCWHNFVMGLNLCQMIEQQEHEEEVTKFCKEHALEEKLARLSQSVFALNFDRDQHLFFQRQPSGIWQSADESEMQERKEFWKTNKDEKKLISNAMGLMFYSTISKHGKFLPQDLDLNKFCESIMSHFYDKAKQLWKTKISSVEGYEVETQHYRLVDHAMLFLAFSTFVSHPSVEPNLKERLLQAIDHILEIILKRFNVENFTERITYLDADLTRHSKRFLWQDCWLVLALIKSGKCIEQLPSMVQELYNEYVDIETGFLFSEAIGAVSDPTTVKTKTVNDKVRKFSPITGQMYISFINDNALFLLILKCRETYCFDNDSILQLDSLFKKFEESFHRYIEQSKVKKGISDMGAQRLLISDYLIREGLWANSETLFSLLSPCSFFSHHK